MSAVVLNKNWPGQKPEDYRQSPLGWRQFLDIDTEELYSTITDNGWAFSAHHNVDTRMRLNTKTFIKSHYLVADIDKAHNAVEVMSVCPITPTFSYSTPSHTVEAPRCRVVFEVQEPLKHDEYEKAQRGLFQVLGEVIPIDKACWNVARVWYGAKLGAPSAWQGNILTPETVARLIAKCPVSYPKGVIIQPRPIRLGPAGVFRGTNLDLWIDYCVERWGSGGLITPRDSRHSLLLYIGFQLVQWMNAGLVSSVLERVVNYMANVNNSPDITPKEIQDICGHIGG